MRRVITASLCLCLAATGYAAPMASAAPPSYSIVDLGVGDYGIAYGLNESGVVVGHAMTPSSTVEAARWDAGVLTQLPSLNGAGGTLARAVNESGLAVGESYDGLGGLHAVTWSGTTPTDLDTLAGSNYSTAFAVNDTGDVAGEGSAASGYTHAILWNGGVPADLGVPLGGTNSYGRGINSSGQVAGWSEYAAGGGYRAVIWSGSGFLDLGTLVGDDNSTAYAINGAGHVIGESFLSSATGRHAYVWNGTTMVELPKLPGFVSMTPSAINNLDQVVGAGNGQYSSPFLWEAATGVTVDLQSLLPGGSGWRLTQANAINDLGQIAGYGYHDGTLHAFVMSPSTTLAPTDHTVANLPAGGSVTTDSGAPGATPEDPTATTVQTPVAGFVEVLEGVGFSGVLGWTLLGQPVTINAPYSDPSNPFRITFIFDASVIPSGENATTIQIFRDSEEAGPCLGTLIANPDPCVVSRQALAGGDVAITVLSSHASVWGGFVSEGPSFAFDGFYAPVDNPNTLNLVKAGSTVPVKFRLGGDFGLDIFATGSPQSHVVFCDAHDAIDPLKQTTSASASGLKYDPSTGIYTYSWKTAKSWTGCRELVVTLSDGSVHRALFKFKK